jgi:hypothetical protein
MKTPKDILEFHLECFTGNGDYCLFYVSPENALIAMEEYADQFKPKKVKPIDERLADFITSVQASSLGMRADECQKFIDYWTEKSPTGRKMRFEKEPTFDIFKRISRWMNNKKEFSNGKSTKPTTDEAVNGFISH